MATLPNSYNQLYSEFQSLVYGPSMRFFSAQDIINYINRGLVETANAIGGIRIIDTTTVTVAGQQDYTLNNQVRQIVGIEYVTNIGQPNEARCPLEVVTQKDQDFNSRVVPGIGFDAWNLAVTPTPVAVPKYAIFWPTTGDLRLLPPPLNAGDTIWLDEMAVPNALGAGILYNGDPIEMGAVVYKAASLARIKSREPQESEYLTTQWKDACVGIKTMRAKMRRRRSMGDGRFFVSRLRSVNGAQ